VRTAFRRGWPLLSACARSAAGRGADPEGHGGTVAADREGRGTRTSHAWAAKSFPGKLGVSIEVCALSSRLVMTSRGLRA
jgi:hypothetical protein